jgi:hypothetical protein
MQEAVCSYWKVTLLAEKADPVDLDVEKYEETQCGKVSSK